MTTDDQLRPAARAAYEASCAVHGREPDDRDFKVQVMEWLAVARAALAHAPVDPDWPLRARVWTRTSTDPHEKVLEIEGVIGDTHMTCRHTQTMSVADEDVPGLPELYPPERLDDDASVYVRGIHERQGLDGLEREARRLERKISVASSLYRDGRVKAILAHDDRIGRRIDAAVASRQAGALAAEIDAMQARILQAQPIADPGGKAALVLHTSEEHWDRHPSYQAYRESFDPKG